MFDDGDNSNLIGLVLLGLCAVVGGVLVWQIMTGERLRYNGPGWLVWVLFAVFIGAGIYGMARGGRVWGGSHWPDPQTGRRRGGWRRWFRRGNGDDGGRT